MNTTNLVSLQYAAPFSRGITEEFAIVIDELPYLKY